MLDQKTQDAVSRRDAEVAKMKAENINAIIKTRMDSDPVFADRVQGAWADVTNAVHERALVQKPKPKDFEVYHALQVSKDAFMIELHDTEDLEKARDAGINRAAPPVDEPEAVAPVEDDCPQP